jgi:hypothetical protein
MDAADMERMAKLMAKERYADCRKEYGRKVPESIVDFDREQCGVKAIAKFCVHFQGAVDKKPAFPPKSAGSR